MSICLPKLTPPLYFKINTTTTKSNKEKLPGVNLLFDFCVYIFYNCEYNYYINC